MIRCLVRLFPFLVVPICAALGGPAAPSFETVTVNQVLDGDTVVLADGRTVRYLGINAPEKGEPWAEEATQANNRLVGGREVRLQPSGKDEQGRLLGQVFVGTNDVGEALLRQGLAQTFRMASRQVRERLMPAQAQAMSAGLGIWHAAPATGLALVRVEAGPGKGSGGKRTAEFIVLENRGAKPLDMTGWTIQDDTASHRYLVPNFQLAPGASVTLHTGKGKNTDADLFWGQSLSIWNDEGDSVIVRDDQGNLVLFHIYDGRNPVVPASRSNSPAAPRQGKVEPVAD